MHIVLNYKLLLDLRCKFNDENILFLFSLTNSHTLTLWVLIIIRTPRIILQADLQNTERKDSKFYVCESVDKLVKSADLDQLLIDFYVLPRIWLL